VNNFTIFLNPIKRLQRTRVLRSSLPDMVPTYLLPSPPTFSHLHPPPWCQFANAETTLKAYHVLSGPLIQTLIASASRSHRLRCEKSNDQTFRIPLIKGSSFACGLPDNVFILITSDSANRAAWWRSFDTLFPDFATTSLSNGMYFLTGNKYYLVITCLKCSALEQSITYSIWLSDGEEIAVNILKSGFIGLIK